MNIRRSSDLLAVVSDVTLDPEDVFVSFDVISMFTCIPVDLAVDLIMKRSEEIEIFAPTNRVCSEKFSGSV